MDRSTLGLRMQSWHSSMSDPIYAVGSFYFSGEPYPDRMIVEDAIHNLEHDLDERKRMMAGEKVMVQRNGKSVDLRKFAGFTDEQLAEDAEDLEEIVEALKEQMREDHAEPTFDGIKQHLLAANVSPGSGSLELRAYEKIVQSAGETWGHSVEAFLMDCFMPEGEPVHPGFEDSLSHYSFEPASWEELEQQWKESMA
jgi:hypothetical protein